MEMRRSNKMEESQKVMATDFDMPFWRKAGSAIKREVAAIPAALILIIGWSLFVGIFGRMILLR
jgi:hypothetical protein